MEKEKRELKKFHWIVVNNILNKVIAFLGPVVFTTIFILYILHFIFSSATIKLLAFQMEIIFVIYLLYIDSKIRGIKMEFRKPMYRQ